MNNNKHTPISITLSIDDMDSDLIACIGRAYRDGRGVPRDLGRAAEWMRMAAERGPAWAKWELFDVLWRIGTPESFEEMVGLARPLAESGNGEMQGRMGRAYRDGRGVPRDLGRAAEWMRMAADNNVGWVRKELNEVNLLNDAQSIEIIYHVGHFGFFWKYLVHHTTFNKKKKALYLFNLTYVCDSTQDYINTLNEKMRDYGIVATYRESDFFKEDESLVLTCSVEHYDDLFDKMNIDVSKCTIYSGFDAVNTFSLYLTIKKINFIMCDPGNGEVLIDRYDLNKSDKLAHYNNCLRKYRCLNEDCISVEKVLSFSNIKRKYKKTVDYCQCELILNTLSHEDIESICSVFNISRDVVYTDVNLLICSSAWVMMRGINETQYVKIYADLLDYVSDEDTVIKLHPNADYRGVWEKYFHPDDIIRGHIPSQLLSFLNTIQPKKIISTGSSGASLPYATRLDLTPSYMDSFPLITKIYFTLAILSRIGRHTIKNNLNNYGFLNDFVKSTFFSDMYGDYDNTVVLNAVTSNNSHVHNDKYNHQDIAVFLPKDDVSQTISFDSIEYVLRVDIRKTFEKENINKESDEYAFVSVKDETLRTQLIDQTITKEMKHSNEIIKVTITPLCYLTH